MADTAIAATPAADTKAPKVVNVIDGMDSRRMFDSPELAANYLNNASTSFADFDKVPQIVRGVIEDGDDAGNFDPAVYTDDMRVMVAVLANRGEKGKPSTAKAVVITPAPKLDSLLASESGKAWVAKIIDKELNHVAVRLLRTADDMDTVKDQMPLTIADYITSSRESSGGIMETFNTLFKGIIAAVGAKSPVWTKYRLTKNELKKALESKAYADEYYTKAEDRGDKPSLFVMALQLGKREAEKQGLDPAIFDKWLATRDEKPMTTKQDESDEADDFELDDLAFESEDNNTDPSATAEGDAAPVPDSTDAAAKTE